MKNSIKGITLVALVVTIVVLLILAGISITMLTGDNGIINQAQKAKTSTEYAQWEELIDLAIIDAESKNEDATLDNVIDELIDDEIIDDEIIDDESQVDTGTGAITTNEPSYVIEDKLDDYLSNPNYSVDIEESEIASQELFDYEIIEETA